MIQACGYASISQLCRFKHGHHFKQWTGDNSKALMKVCTYLYCDICAIIFTNLIVFTRCTCQLFMVSCIQMLFNTSLPSLTSVTLPSIPILTVLPLMPLTLPCIASIPIVKCFNHLVYVKVASHYPVNIHLSTIMLISKTLVLPMDSAHPLQNLSTLLLLRNHGAPVILKLWGKC